MAFDNIPHELREYKQFCVWRYEETENGKPTKVPYSISGYNADITNPAAFCSYDEAINVLAKNNQWSGLGFVLTKNDPFGFIDLDEPKSPTGEPLPPDEYAARFERQKAIYSEFNSYSELSPSGKGLHIIVKGNIESGRRRDSVEVYSDLRFMTMTGDVFNNAPIMDRQEQFRSLWAEMGKGRNAEMFYAGLDKAELSDAQVIEIASQAVNAEKFTDLYFAGNWQKYYPSQSEADFAIVDILAFYSRNRAQVQKLFLASKLAERIKSRAQYRINYMLNRCFDNMLPPVDFDGLRNQVNEAIEKQAKANELQHKVEEKISTAIAINEDSVYTNLPPPQELEEIEGSPYMPPGGLLGEIARFIYAQAPLPVPEIALAGAIGFMSGIVGKAYNVSGLGINQYTLLLAATGCGKESMSQGIAKIMSEVIKLVPAGNDFMGPGEIASPQALVKELNDKPCCLSIVGEFGLHLKQMGSENAPPHMLGLRRLLLDLFNKSGEGNKMQKTIYSDRTKNTENLTAPAFSILGESTPERFYETLNENMISEGLLPRFTIIEYLGDRVSRNKGSGLVKPSNELVQAVATLCANALQLTHQKKVLHIQIDSEAQTILDKFETFADNQIRGSLELRRQLWSRALVKALKLCATVAIGQNPFEPTINAQGAQWAINIVLVDIKNMAKRFESGNVGADNNENKQLELLVKAVHKFLTSKFEAVEKMCTKNCRLMHENKVVPYSYIQRATAASSTFKNDKLGANNALKRALRILVERGDLQQIARAEGQKRFNSVADAYGVMNVQSFGL